MTISGLEPIYVTPERVQLATLAIQRCVPEFEEVEVIAIMCEIGLGDENLAWSDNNEARFLLTDLQSIAFAAALASALDGREQSFLQPIAAFE